jgi:uracil phosphoribosyltransferase
VSARDPESPAPARPIVVEHPFVADRLSSLRDEATPPGPFRRLVAELTTFVAYEALRDLGTRAVRVDTPVARGVLGRRLAEPLLVVPILRAGLGMVPALQELVHHSEVAHVGLSRDEHTLSPDVYLDRLPPTLAKRRVVVCDPMLATGGSMTQVCTMLAERGARSITALCLIASAPGLERLAAAHPAVRVACAAVDPELEGRGFIVPGLGDAGDRLFGPPA